MFFDRYVLRDGQVVETPVYDGILERADKLVNKWQEINPELNYICRSLLLSWSLERADTVRMLEGFEKEGVSRNTALGYIHSHVPENFMIAGVHALLEGLSWRMERPASSSPSDDDLVAPPPFPVLAPENLSPEGLLDEISHDFASHIGSEATEHLVQAMLAADRYIRNKQAERLEKFQAHNQSEEGPNACDEIIATYRDQLTQEESRNLLDLIAPTLRKYPPDELEDIFNEFKALGEGDINQTFQTLTPEDLGRFQKQFEAEINLFLR
ncbi:MAG TPA: hypothetical protein VKK79_04475 [Candidatus Lokiarchaeia archaeon]|nr:hypothetical protein [Candidatus Lokiarchaeia archaeon]